MATDKIQFTDKTVKLEKITLSRKKNKQKLNWIRLAERNKIPTDTKYINPRITLNIDIKNPSDLNSYINIIVENNDGTIKEEYTIYIDNINARSYNYNIISWNYFDNLKISLNTSFIGSIYLDIVGSIKQ